jgi:hypothetical protein
MKKFYLALMGLLLSSNFISDVNAARKNRRRSTNHKGPEEKTKAQNQSDVALARALIDFLNSKEGRETWTKYVTSYPSDLLKMITEESSKTK